MKDSSEEKRMIRFGIMQGRLTPSNGRGIQFFPFEFWKEEFHIGQRIGIQEIEWIFDYPNYNENPIWSAEGQEEISKKIEKTGIVVKTVCWDYFMRRPFYKQSGTARMEWFTENKRILEQVLAGMEKIGAELIEIPLVDDSSIQTDNEREEAIRFIRWACDLAAGKGMKVGLETDFPVGVFVDFLNEIGCGNVKANYDSGNSSGLGYDAKDELESLGEYVYNVHIKDRLKGNGTMKLGTGSADFDKVFGTLKKIGYGNSFIMQAARGEDGEESKEVAGQLSFVKEYLKKYNMK